MTPKEKEVHKVFVVRTGALQGQAYNFLTSNNIKKPDNHLLRTLANDAYLRTVKKYESGKYEDYPIKILLSQQLKDVCAEYIRKPSIDQKRYGSLPLAGCEYLPTAEPTAQEKLENAEEIRILESSMDEELREIFKLRAEKVPHKEIATRFRTTEAAIKMRISRWQQKNKKDS